MHTKWKKIYIELKKRGFEVGSATFENYLDMLNNNSNIFA